MTDEHENHDPGDEDRSYIANPCKGDAVNFDHARWSVGRRCDVYPCVRCAAEFSGSELVYAAPPEHAVQP